MVAPNPAQQLPSQIGRQHRSPVSQDDGNRSQALTSAAAAIADITYHQAQTQRLIRDRGGRMLSNSRSQQAVERKVLASQLVPNEILEVMNNSTKGRRVEEHDK